MLVVDDFGIKYIKKEDLDHLINSLDKYYEVSVDMEGKEFVKIELDWDYTNGKVHLSMKPYLEKVLRQFNNLIPSKQQDSPYLHMPPKFRTMTQLADFDTLPPVGKSKQTLIQRVSGVFVVHMGI